MKSPRMLILLHSWALIFLVIGLKYHFSFLTAGQNKKNCGLGIFSRRLAVAKEL
jgi:hypothetical protein